MTWRERSVAAALLLVVAAVVVVVVAGRLGSATTASNGHGQELADYVDRNLRVQYPSSWDVYNFGVGTTRSNVLAVLSSMALEPPCEGDGKAVVCDATNYQLVPNAVVVSVEAVSSPIPISLEEFARGDQVRLGFTNAVFGVFGDERGTGADRTLVWTVERGVANNFYEVRAEIRGPDLERLEAQVRQVVESLRFND